MWQSFMLHKPLYKNLSWWFSGILSTTMTVASPMHSSWELHFSVYFKFWLGCGPGCLIVMSSALVELRARHKTCHRIHCNMAVILQYPTRCLKYPGFFLTLSKFPMHHLMRVFINWLFLNLILFWSFWSLQQAVPLQETVWKFAF